MTRSRSPRASSSTSTSRMLLALLLAGVLLVLAATAAFALLTDRSPLSLRSLLPSLAPQKSLAQELPPGEPTLSPGLVHTATPSPTARIATSVPPTTTGPKATRPFAPLTPSRLWPKKVDDCEACLSGQASKEQR